jgi:hypothetical protein
MADEDSTPEQDEEDAQALGCTARLEIRWANKMTEEEKLGVAEWLRKRAENLLADGHNYAAVFTSMFDPDD